MKFNITQLSVSKKLTEQIKNLLSEGNKECAIFSANCHQSIEEMVMLYEELQPRKFDSFVELGVCYGGSLLIYSTLLCLPRASIIGIDIKITDGMRYVKNKLQLEGKNVTFYIENTLTAHKHLQNNSIDLLHIDAQHDNTVYRDWELYYPKVKKDGIILLHDVCLHKGCQSIMNDLITSGASYKIIKSSTTALGIGIIYNDKSINLKKNEH